MQALGAEEKGVDIVFAVPAYRFAKFGEQDIVDNLPRNEEERKVDRSSTSKWRRLAAETDPAEANAAAKKARQWALTVRFEPSNDAEEVNSLENYLA